MITNTAIERMIALRREGKTLVEVGNLMHLSATTVRRYTQHITFKKENRGKHNKKKLIRMGIDSKLLDEEFR